MSISQALFMRITCENILRKFHLTSRRRKRNEQDQEKPGLNNLVKSYFVIIEEFC